MNELELVKAWLRYNNGLRKEVIKWLRMDYCEEWEEEASE